MKLVSAGFNEGETIPARYAFARIATASPIELSDNLNPPLAWTDAPRETRSFALICHDPDVPSIGDDVNQADRRIPHGLPRVDFVHWILLDIPASTVAIAEGRHAQGVTPRGKPGPHAPDGMRHGLNDYTGWFAGDEEMAGTYFGYDGPCPPWNDERLHHYVFTLYALDVPALDVAGVLDGSAVRRALEGHVLDRATLTGTYSLNPALAR